MLDIDNGLVKQGGRAFVELCETHSWHPDTFGVLTGRGWHLYFSHPGGLVSGSVGIIGHGLDLRGDGSCVVASGSTHESGVKYQQYGDAFKLEVLPDCLIPVPAPHKTPMSVRRALPGPLEEISRGNRNDTLFRFACSLRARGAELTQVVEGLHNFNLRCNPPLDCATLTRIAQSACKYERGNMSVTPLHWFKRDVAKWSTCPDIRSLEDYQSVWYVNLEMVAFMAGGYLPQDPKLLCMLARAQDREKFNSEYKKVLADCRKDKRDGMKVLLMPSAHGSFENVQSRYIHLKQIRWPERDATRGIIFGGHCQTLRLTVELSSARTHTSQSEDGRFLRKRLVLGTRRDARHSLTR